MRQEADTTAESADLSQNWHAPVAINWHAAEPRLSNCAALPTVSERTDAEGLSAGLGELVAGTRRLHSDIRQSIRGECASRIVGEDPGPRHSDAAIWTLRVICDAAPGQRTCSVRTSFSQARSDDSHL